MDCEGPDPLKSTYAAGWLAGELGRTKSPTQSRPPQWAALLFRLHFGPLRKLEPFARNAKPYFFVERIYKLLGDLSGFLGPLSVSRGIFKHVNGHTGRCCTSGRLTLRHDQSKRAHLEKNTKFYFGNQATAFFKLGTSAGREGRGTEAPRHFQLPYEVSFRNQRRNVGSTPRLIHCVF